MLTCLLTAWPIKRIPLCPNSVEAQETIAERKTERVFTYCWQHTLKKKKVLKSLEKKYCLVQLVVWTVKLLFLYSSIQCHVQSGNMRKAFVWHRHTTQVATNNGTGFGTYLPTSTCDFQWLALLNNSHSNFSFSHAKLMETQKCVQWPTKSQQLLEKITVVIYLWCEIPFAAEPARIFLTMKALASPFANHMFRVLILCLSEHAFGKNYLSKIYLTSVLIESASY